MAQRKTSGQIRDTFNRKYASAARVQPDTKPTMSDRELIDQALAQGKVTVCPPGEAAGILKSTTLPSK